MLLTHKVVRVKHRLILQSIDLTNEEIRIGLNRVRRGKARSIFEIDRLGTYHEKQ